MSYWIFVVVDHRIGLKSRIRAEDVLRTRVKKKFWLLGEKTPHIREIKEGDRVVFYVGRRAKRFMGCATIARPPRRLSEEQRRVMIDDYEGKHLYMIELEDVEFWKDGKAIEELVDMLSFIKRKERWGIYFQPGVVRIGEEDFKLICSA